MLSPRRAILREATAEQHRRVDMLLEHGNTFGDLSAYGEHLRQMHLFHRNFNDKLITKFFDSPGHWQVGERIVWLAQDLRALGLAPMPSTDALAIGAPIFSNNGEALGALYVLIGSALGAAVLVKRLDAMGVTSDRGGMYLSALASSRLWPDFLAVLEAADLVSDEDLVAGAAKTFDFLIDHLGELQGA